MNQPLRIGAYEYPRVLLGAGCGNVDGSGWRYHKLLPWSLLGDYWNDPRGIFQTKGLTDGRVGNLGLLDDGITTKKILPDCITGEPFTPQLNNSVGLSGLPYWEYYAKGILRDRELPFAIQYIATAEEPEGRIEQTQQFATACIEYFPSLKVRPLIFLGGGCPNVAHKSTFAWEFCEEVRILKTTGSSVGVNFSPIVDIDLALEVAEVADVLAPVNTISYDWMYENDSVFPFGKISPLVKRGYTCGGISSPRCRKHGLRTCKEIRAHNKKIILFGGPGILYPWHIDEFVEVCDGIQIAALLPIMRPFKPLLDWVLNRAANAKWRLPRESWGA